MLPLFFVYFIFLTCNGDLRGIDGFQDVVKANVLGSGQVIIRLQSVVELTHFPHGTRTCNLHIRGSGGPVSAW
jgi:hypothetical protein